MPLRTARRRSTSERADDRLLDQQLAVMLVAGHSSNAWPFSSASHTMEIDVTSEVLIRRPRADVAAVMFNPRHEAVWTTGVVAVRPLGEGRLREGSRVEREVRFLGRRFDYAYEVVDADDGRFVVMRVEDPFPMHIRYELEDAPGGTTARIRARGDAGGFFGMAAPLLGLMVRRNITADLNALKEHVESTPP